METIKYWLRWLAVLPGGLLGGVLLTFPLHFVLYQTLTSFIDPYPELPERILSPFVIAAGLVWLGAKIAPSHKIEAAVVLFGLWMVLLGGFVARAVFVGHIDGMPITFHGGGVAPVMAFVGGVVGFIAVRKELAQAKAVNTSEDTTAEQGRLLPAFLLNGNCRM